LLLAFFLMRPNVLVFHYFFFFYYMRHAGGETHGVRQLSASSQTRALRCVGNFLSNFCVFVCFFRCVPPEGFFVPLFVFFFVLLWTPFSGFGWHLLGEFFCSVWLHYHHPFSPQPCTHTQVRVPLSGFQQRTQCESSPRASRSSFWSLPCFLTFVVVSRTSPPRGPQDLRLFPSTPRPNHWL